MHCWCQKYGTLSPVELMLLQLRGCIARVLFPLR